MKLAMDVEEAIARAGKGDLEAYARVVSEFHGPLRSFIAAYCPVREQIDEVAQAAFVRAFERLDRYEPGTRFYSWLKQIARNALLAELEAQKREAQGRRRYLEHLRACHASEMLVSEGSDTYVEQVEALRRCLRELPDYSQSLVFRRYGEGRPISEIATTDSKQAGTVKVALFRVHQALRRCVARRMGAPSLELQG